MIGRRTFLGGVSAAAIGATVLGGTHAGLPRGDGGRSERLLGGVSDELLHEYSEDATSLDLDTGARAGLHGALSDRTIAGVGARPAAARHVSRG